MSKLVIIGDSFCACEPGWPGMLSKLLDRKLLSYGIGGQHWWGAKKFLDGVTLEPSDTLIVVHTNAERIPTDAVEPGQVNFSNPNLDVELDRAVHLYFKYLFNHEFLQWAQQRWIEQVDQLSNKLQVIHLHSFSGTTTLPTAGLSVLPCLTSISLEEVNNDMSALFNDTRLNHLSNYNNQILANQLAQLIIKKERGVALLDTTQFSYK